MLVHCKVTPLPSPPLNISLGFLDNLPIPIYTPGWRETKHSDLARSQNLDFSTWSPQHNLRNEDNPTRHVTAIQSKLQLQITGSVSTNGCSSKEIALHFMFNLMYGYKLTQFSLVRFNFASARNKQKMLLTCCLQHLQQTVKPPEFVQVDP